MFVFVTEAKPRIHKKLDHVLSKQFKMASFLTSSPPEKPESSAPADTDIGKRFLKL